MITKIIGHLLFPRSPAWERRRRANVAMLVGLTTIGFAAVLGAVLYWMNSKPN
jgi:hypothetical protein